MNRIFLKSLHFKNQCLFDNINKNFIVVGWYQCFEFDINLDILFTYVCGLS